VWCFASRPLGIRGPPASLPEGSTTSSGPCAPHAARGTVVGATSVQGAALDFRISAGVWYEVEVLLDRPNNLMTIWIDGQNLGSFQAAANPDDLYTRIDTFTLESGHTGPDTFFDDVEVSVAREKRALVVGIGDYGASVPCLVPPDLCGAVKGAEDFTELLVSRFHFQTDSEHMVFLTDSPRPDDDISSERVLDGISWLAESSRPGDLAVIYVASHGYRDESTMEPEYLAANPGLLSDSMFAEAVSRIAPQVTVLVVLDISLAGGFIVDGGVWSDLASDTPANRIVLTGCTEDIAEDCLFHPLFGPVFTEFLIDGFADRSEKACIRDDDKDGRTSVEDAFEYARCAVKHSRDTLRDLALWARGLRLQTPLMYDGYPTFSAGHDRNSGELSL